MTREEAIDVIRGYLINEVDTEDKHTAFGMAISALKAQEACRDAISRQWCLSEYDKRHQGQPGGARKIIEEAPSVQPEPHYDEWCTDCKEYNHERHCCPRWNRVIRETLKDAQPEIIRCKDCQHRGDEPIADGRYWCEIHDAFMYYCSDAERRTDESD